ncbi:MAG: hypothetical protein ACM3KE_13790 [Hyphomicrobiales bacterium]
MERLYLEKKIQAALIENRIDPNNLRGEASEKGVAHIAGISIAQVGRNTGRRVALAGSVTGP